MSGVICRGEEDAWVVASWVFDHVVRLKRGGVGSGSFASPEFYNSFMESFWPC